MKKSKKQKNLSGFTDVTSCPCALNLLPVWEWNTGCDATLHSLRSSPNGTRMLDEHFFLSFLAKMSSLWQDHIHNKAFIFLITLFFFCFFIYRYLYTLCTCFHDCVFPTVTVRYEKGTKSAAAPQRWGCGRASSNPRQHTASSRKKRTRPPQTQQRAGSRCTSTKRLSVEKNRYASPLSLSWKTPPRRVFRFVGFFFSLLLIF